MTGPVFWLVFIIALLSLIMLGGISPAHAKTVKVCAAVTLPAPGKCTYLTLRGYRVRVCR